MPRRPSQPSRADQLASVSSALLAIIREAHSLLVKRKPLAAERVLWNICGPLAGKAVKTSTTPAPASTRPPERPRLEESTASPVAPAIRAAPPEQGATETERIRAMLPPSVRAMMAQRGG